MFAKSFAGVAVIGTVLATASGAFAHTITIGYENAGVGTVNFWYGSYHYPSESPSNEGSFNLVGINGNPFASTTVAFDMVVGVKPAGLEDGVTNFLATSYYSQGPDGFDDVFSWQGVQFTGLTPGDYQFTYIPIAYPTQKWAPWDDSILSATISLDGDIVQCGAPGLPSCEPGTDVPEPATLALFGMGLLGLGAIRRRKTH